jgi:16S rRNA C1402 (ribose-2'-O) methylase RsmI
VEYFKSQPVRGEFTLVIAGKLKEAKGIWTEAELVTAIDRELLTEKSAKDISVELAELSGWNKKEVYRLINRKE